MAEEKIAPNLLQHLLSKAKTEVFETGDMIIDIDQKINGIPLVLKGLLKVYKEDDNDNEILLYYLSPGEICSMGIKCCLTDGKSHTRVYSEEESEVLFISKPMVEELQSNPEWNTFIVQALANRIEELLQVADDLAFKKLDQRVLNYLEKKAKLNSTDTVKLTHKQISEDLNSSREVISRVLKKLEQEGALTHQRNEIKLL